MVTGKCHICGAFGKLSFEHSPPRKAFNNDVVLYAEMQKLWAGGDPNVLTGTPSQRGVGAYTLCESCNNSTGSWYGSAYVSLAKQGMEYLQAARAAGYYMNLPYRIHPLRAIKQVICMFMSANSPEFQKAQPELARFVLDRRTRHLPSHIRVSAFFTISDRSRSSGVAGLMTGFGIDSCKNYILSEITFPPFGFVMSLGSPAPDERLADITYFADFGYDDERALWLRLAVLPIYTGFPGDYRPREKVLRDGGRLP